MSSKLPTGFTGRTLTTLKLAAKVGVGYARRTIGTTPAAQDEPAQNESAEALVEQLGRMKGLMMKFGQMASYLPGNVGSKAQGILAQLQASSPPLPFDAVVAVVEAEFGKPLDQLFETFEHDPLAAASIGQVHRAVFRGQQVAVKVQYPGILDVMKQDLRNVGLMAKFGMAGAASSGTELAEELRDRILEECDYRIEARNHLAFTELLCTIPNASAPTLVPERSGTTVITSEFVNRLNFASFLAQANRKAQDVAGSAIFNACFFNLFHRGIFNGDPHPGNYLFDADGNVTFLDFGSVRTFDASFIDDWKRLAKVITTDNRAGYKDAMADVGFVPNPKKFDYDYQWQAVRHLYQPFLSSEFTFTPKFIEETYDNLLFKNPNKLTLALPREWLLLNRLQWGLFAVLAQMRASGNFSDLWRAAIESKTDPIQL